MYLAGSVGKSASKPAGIFFPAVSLCDLYETVYSFDLNVHFPTNFTSSFPTTLVSASYPWNVQTPSNTSSANVVCAGANAVTVSFIMYLVGSVGKSAFNPAGNALPAVSLSNA